MPHPPIHAPRAPALSPALIAAAVEAAGKLVLLLERGGDRPDDFLIRGVNGAAPAVTGYAASELMDRPLTLLVDAPAVPPELLAAMRSAASQHTEMLCRRADGRSAWLSVHLTPVAPPGAARFIAICRDVTALHLVDERHHAVEGLLAKVFLSVEAGVAIVGADGIVLMANPFLHHLLRMPADGMVGRNALEFVAPVDRARLAEARERQLVEGGDYTVAGTFLDGEGTEVPVSLTAAVVEREDLRRFRVLTIIPAGARLGAAAGAAPPVRVRVAGNIQMVGLEEVKAALGADWPPRARRAMDVAEHVLRQRCGPHDSFSRSGPCGFVVCFGEGTEQEAAFRAAMMARDIRDRLIGRGETAASSQVTAVTASVAVPMPEPPPPAFSALLAGELARRGATVQADARTCLAQAADRESCVIEPVFSGTAPQAVAGLLRLAPASENRIATAMAALQEPDRAAFDLDGLLVDMAAAELARLAARGDCLRVLVDVRFEVFAGRHRTERYLAHCRRLEPGARQALTLVLTDIPPGATGTRLLDCAVRLRPFCAGLGFQTESLALPFADLSFAGSPIVVVPARACDPHGRMLSKLQRLVTVVHTHRGRLLVRGLATRAAAQPLLAAGVDMVSLAGPHGQRTAA